LRKHTTQETAMREMLKRNIIVIVVLLYLFFMASFKIWPVW
jgi:hypothetical protein